MQLYIIRHKTVENVIQVIYELGKGNYADTLQDLTLEEESSDRTLEHVPKDGGAWGLAPL